MNYTPRYYLINGVAFDKTNANTSLFKTTPPAGVPPGTGKVLVRLVNAGLRMHVPSIVGSQTGADGAASGLSLIAEDGNPLPGVPRVQSEVFMAAGKTYDVMINVPNQRRGARFSHLRPRAEPLRQRHRAGCWNAGIYRRQRRWTTRISYRSDCVANPDTYNSLSQARPHGVGSCQRRDRQ